ncbi:MAG: glycosyltransferase [Burkholderiales bacterium]|nr:glycosyltransferase [Burkholderiales bacterium]
MSLQTELGDKRPGVVHVVHARGGGTEKYIRELIAASGTHYRHYFLRVHADRFVVKPAATDDAPGYAWPRPGADPRWLLTICAWLRIGVAHVHSLVGGGDDLIEALTRAGVPYCYSAHDMYLPCPTVYLIDSQGNYCDATTDPAACRKCLAGFPAHAGTDIVAWRERHRRFLAAARKVYAPSRWAATTLGKYFPGIEVTVAPPHAAPVYPLDAGEMPNAFPLPDDGLRHVGMLGAIGPEKGARIVEAMAARIRERDLPLRLVVIGYTDRQSRDQSADHVLTVHGPYRRDEIEPLLDAYRVGLVVFPTIWPETFSYTLSEAWSAGRPVLVPPRGALRERVEVTGAGWLIDAWPEVDALLDQLMSLTAPENAMALAKRSQLARAADDDAQDDARVADALYRSLLAKATPPAEPPGARDAVDEAARRAAGVPG